MGRKVFSQGKTQIGKKGKKTDHENLQVGWVMYDQPDNIPIAQRKIVTFASNDPVIIKNKAEESNYALDIDPNERNLYVNGKGLDRLTNAFLLAGSVASGERENEVNKDQQQEMEDELKKMNTMQDYAYKDTNEQKMGEEKLTDTHKPKTALEKEQRQKPLALWEKMLGYNCGASEEERLASLKANPEIWVRSKKV